MVLDFKSSYTSKYEMFARFGFFFFCVSAMFSDLITSVLGNSSIYLFFFAALFFLILSVFRSGIMKIKTKAIAMIGVWLAFVVIFVLCHNRQIAHRSFFAAIRWVYFFSVIPLLAMMPKEWYRGLLKILAALTIINILFVGFFLVFPDKYHIMFQLWGFWPTGTESGTAGYRAGIASHYSENAMVLTIGMMVTASMFIAEIGREKRKSLQLTKLVLIFVYLFCIILTAKRAHLLFGTMSILFGYFLYKPELRKKNFFRLVILVAVMLVIFVIVAAYVPAIGYIYERFTTMGEDEESTTRFEMWSLAFRNFKEHPIFGMGWAGFKYEFNEHLYNPATRSERYAFLNAHNVYIQLLSECGVVGFLMFGSNAAYIFFKTIGLFRNKLIRYKYEFGVAIFSIVMQTFFYMYCCTGNCLYDMMFSYYAIAVGMSIGLNTQKRIL